MRKILLLLLILVACPLLAKDVYKGTAPDGEVIYSDTYFPGSQRIRVSGSKSSASQADETNSQSASGALAEGGSYSSLEIVQPENEQTIRSGDGNVNVGVMLTPGLGEGHSLHVFVDGTQLKGDMRSTQFTLTGLNRGTHSLRVKVVDDQGNSLAEAPAVNFHLRQEAIDKP